MNNNKWTPGPWRTALRNDHNAMITVSCVVIGQTVQDVDTGFDDASLISAAPELYEALDRLVTHIEGSGVSSNSDIEIAYDAMAKANGGKR